MSTQHDETELDEQQPTTDSAFLQLLQHHRSGNLLSDLSAAMREVVEAAENMGKPAGITLKIVVKPAGNASGAVVVADKLTKKLPEPTPTTSFFFTDDHHNLMRNDPRQKELPLRAIQGGKAVDVTELKRVAQA